MYLIPRVSLWDSSSFQSAKARSFGRELDSYPEITAFPNRNLTRQHSHSTERGRAFPLPLEGSPLAVLSPIFRVGARGVDEGVRSWR